LGVRKDAAC